MDTMEEQLEQLAKFIAPGLTQFQQQLTEAAKAYYQCISFDKYVEYENIYHSLLEQAFPGIAEQDYCEHCNTTLTPDELAYAAKIDTYYCTNCAYILLK